MLENACVHARVRVGVQAKSHWPDADLFDDSLGEAASDVLATVSEGLDGCGGEPRERLQRRLRAAAVSPVCRGVVGSTGGTLGCRSGFCRCADKSHLCAEGFKAFCETELSS